MKTPRERVEPINTASAAPLRRSPHRRLKLLVRHGCFTSQGDAGKNADWFVPKMFAERKERIPGRSRWLLRNEFEQRYPFSEHLVDLGIRELVMPSSPVSLLRIHHRSDTAPSS
jgi:hypothetical protein